MKFILYISENMKKCLKIIWSTLNQAKKWIYLEGDTGKLPYQKHTLAKEMHYVDYDYVFVLVNFIFSKHIFIKKLFVYHIIFFFITS